MILFFYTFIQYDTYVDETDKSYNLWTWNVILLKYSVKWFMFFFLCLYPWMDIVISFGCVETEERNISILCCFMVDYYREPVYQNWNVISTIWNFILEKWFWLWLRVLFIKKNELPSRLSLICILFTSAIVYLAMLQKEMLTCDRVEI